MSSAHPRDTASVSTHVLDTSIGRPAAGVAVRLSARPGSEQDWSERGGSVTDADGRCTDLPPLPQGTTQVRLVFATGPYLHRMADPQAEEKQDAPRTRDSASVERDSGGFFPEVTVDFTVTPGEHHHVPLLLNPFGYSVYRGS
jgi:5-hydroxyisourate hydrolase